MSWRFGIPDFIGNYVYFEDLQNTENNCYAARIYKQQLYQKAQKSLSYAMNSITDTSKITQANKFLATVATNERNKEIHMIKSFCKSTGMQFPVLQQYLDNPQKIENDPQGFYVQLTNGINIARRGLNDYLDELKRIKKNIKDKTRTLENYKADDYRYRLVGDISSFINRLRGNYKDIADTDKYSLKVQDMVMNILSSTGAIQAISSGADFAAIAATVLADVERQVQKEMDKMLDDPNQNRDLVSIIDNVSNKIETEYIDKIKTRNKLMTPVQKALSDINGLDFARITQNAKELLGLKTFDLDNSKFQTHLEKVAYREDTTTNAKIKSIRDKLSVNTLLKNNLSLLKFSINGSSWTKHGSIYELVESSIGTALGSGTNILGNSAVDIITYNIGWDIQVDNSAMDSLLSSMASAITDSVFEDTDTPANIRSVKNQLAIMNAKLDDAIGMAEQQLSDLKQFNLDDIFVYHETLKLHSSAETGRNSRGGGFEGRKLGILKYIDYMGSAGNNAMIASQEDLAFLGLNLTVGAIAETAKEPLEKYFSMYASLLMFDDISNMAMEATNQVQNDHGSGHITQIHLYNLNGIYVPASMLLSFVADTVNEAGDMITSGLAAKATISAPKSNEAYNKWLERKAAGNGRLYRTDWEDVAKEAAEQTKVTITFMQAFLAFIGQLGAI